MAKKSSSSASDSTTQQQDNRVVAGEGATALGSGAFLSNTSNTYSDDDLLYQSFADNSSRYAYLDSSDRSQFSLSASDDRDTYGYTSDSSNRSVTNISGSDPGAVRLGQFNAQLLGAVNEQNTDAVRFISQLGADGIRAMGGSATDLYSRAGSNSLQAWDRTLEASEGILARVLDSSARTTDAAKVIAQSAIGSFQPSENKSADTFKLAAIAAAALGLVFILRKA